MALPYPQDEDDEDDEDTPFNGQPFADNLASFDLFISKFKHLLPVEIDKDLVPFIRMAYDAAVDLKLGVHDGKKFMSVLTQNAPVEIEEDLVPYLEKAFADALKLPVSGYASE